MAAGGFNARYIADRSDPGTMLGYGLERRTRQMLESIAANLPDEQHLDVIDFGCAEGAMLAQVAHLLGDRHRSSLGLDVFRSGVPVDDPSRSLSFLPVDLFATYPYPVADASRDIAIVSAFIKHHPEPMRFLREVSRILRPAGIAVILDPRPYVVRMGQLVGKFSLDYNPSVWSRASMERLIRNNGLPLLTLSYVRYWVAPTGWLYRRGFEKTIPDWLRSQVAMHQCLVLQRVP